MARQNSSVGTNTAITRRSCARVTKTSEAFLRDRNAATRPSRLAAARMTER